jgi:hypothetical protein
MKTDGGFIGDEYGGALDLIDEGEIPTICEVGVHIDGQVLSVLPELNLFEV